MNNPDSGIERWLIEGVSENQQEQDTEIWDVIFDEGRQLVFFQFGPYQKLFIRPDKFVKHFYHSLYPLAVENWPISEQIQLYDDFCRIDIQIDIRFQATLKYAQRQMDKLSKINEQVKETYYQAICQLMKRELLKLQNDAWVRTGLGKIERSLTVAINEMLVLENIQSQTRCTIHAEFSEFPDVQLGKEGIYLSVLKKSFEVSDEQREEYFRQQQQQQEQIQEHKQKQLEQFEQDAEFERQKQAQQAEHHKQMLLEKEQQLKNQLEIETRLHSEKIQHDNYLSEITLDVELKSKQERENRIRIAEEKLLAEKLSHQAILKEQELHAGIETFEQDNTRWIVAKDKTHRQQLEMERRQQNLTLDMQAANKQYEEELHMEMKEREYKNKANIDVYLRREIELLELDKKRMELQIAIKESREGNR